MSLGLRVVAVLLAAAGGACTSVRKTIESENGDLIDCVDIYQQPAFKDVPPDRREILKPEKSIKAMAAASSASIPRQERRQTWRKYGSCPAGTVPIRRASSSSRGAVDDPEEVAELVRRASPFRRPGPAAATAAAGNSSLDLSKVMDQKSGTVEVAAAYATNGPYHGARAHIPHWKVNVHPDEFSMSYILVGYTLDTGYKPGSGPPPELTNQIAVGLVAWPKIHNDSLPRLFVYYTNDGGVNNNCFDTGCGGFRLNEQSSFALGDSFSDSDSEVGGDTFAVTVSIHRGLSDENWYVSVMDEVIGYYPETIFNTRFPEAVYVEMGGRVLNTRPGGSHTTTPMGNTIPACAGSRFAATIMEYNGINYNGFLFSDPARETITTSPTCYSANPIGFSTSNSGYNVAYGGPGGIYCDQA